MKAQLAQQDNNTQKKMLQSEFFFFNIDHHNDAGPNQITLFLFNFLPYKNDLLW